MNKKYWDIPHDEYEWCNIVWDFFENTLIRRSYGQLWNKHFPEKRLKSTWDFHIRNQDFMNFIREVFCDDTLSKLFLSTLRNNVQKLQNKDRFQYDTKQIVAFILVWMEMQGRVLSLPVNVSNMIQQEVVWILFDAGKSPIHTFDNDEQVRRDTGLSLLVQNNICPIQQDGNIIFWIGLWDFKNWIFTVTDEHGNVRDIDRNWNEVNPLEIRTILLWKLQEELKLYEECLEHLKTATPSTPLPERFRVIIQAIITKHQPNREEMSLLVIAKLQKKIQKLRKWITERTYVHFADLMEQYWAMEPPPSPFLQ